VDLAVPGEEATAVAAEPDERPVEAPRRERERRDERAPAAPTEARADERAAQAVSVRAEAAGNGAAAASPAAAAMPAVPSFELPLTDLQQIAHGAGLQWVLSDADKVQAVQQAIAAEPKPAHVPRERKPAVLADEGPLVLVETRKDLSQFTLPFERQQATQRQSGG
jgi:ribonuclease E